jgi:hypothetical protein
MSVIATGVNKVLTVKKQSGLGVYTTTAIASGQNLRRVTSNLDKKKASYSSKEIRPSQQVANFRHGVVSVDGTISGELSIGSYQAFTESICRQAVQAAVTASGLTDIVSASTAGAAGTLTTTAGQFLTSGFKVGMVVRCTGFTTTATGNNTTNMLITAINGTGKQMTVIRLDGSPVIAKTETGAVAITEVGKHTFIPQTGQTRDYYSIEHWFSDIAQSELFTDCVVTQMDVKLPATGMAGVDFQIKGLNMTPGTAQAFSSPAAVSGGAPLAAANGVIFLQGSPIALITGLNFSVKGGHTTVGGVVGSNVEPDIFPGTVTVDGQATVLFQDATVRDMFLNETEVTIVAVFTTDNTATSGFQAYTFPRVKMGGAAKDDGEKGLVMTMPFTALESVSGGAGTTSHATTFVVQDSAFV